jgi:hypothetical protein
VREGKVKPLEVIYKEDLRRTWEREQTEGCPGAACSLFKRDEFIVKYCKMTRLGKEVKQSRAEKHLHV